MNIKFIYPNYFAFYGVAYTCLSIAEGMVKQGCNVSVLGIASDDSFEHELYSDALTGLIKRIALKLFSRKVLTKITEYVFLKGLKEGDVVYLWPGVSIDLIKKAKEFGCLVISENINTHTQYANNILTMEYARIGLPKFEDISETAIEHENDVHKNVDFIFAPSPFVTKSLLESGVSKDKIIDTSYGWSEERQQIRVRDDLDSEIRFNAVFIGSLSIRKGVHLLIEAWEKANIKGKLILAGKVESGYVESLCNDFFKRKDVEYKGYVEDIGQLYSECDVFLFPSLEEGGPMVTYEAMAAGLAVIASPMGAGRVMRDGIDGYIIDPHDTNGWINALRSLSDCNQVLNSFSRNAKIQANHFTWDKVAKQRLELLVEAIKD